MSTKLDCENIARLAVILARYSKHEVNSMRCASVAVALAKVGRKLERLAEKECNEGITDTERQRIGKLLSQCRQLLVDNEYEHEKIQIYSDGDPRGYCLRLRFPGGESNNMGGDFGV